MVMVNAPVRETLCCFRLLASCPLSQAGVRLRRLIFFIDIYYVVSTNAIIHLALQTNEL